MKRNYLLLVVFLATSITLYAQSSDEKSIRGILADITTANKTGNFKVMENIYASDLVFISAQGKKFNKTERIAFLNSNPHPESFAFENVKIRMFGNTAVVNAEVHQKLKGQSAQISYATLVMIKEGNRWVEVNGQATIKG